ncbi:18504_t:CDS:2 [Gigaspora margarita]|uniref:18504_t:CDS:1 n=1 Tax=Gigaspora margarita TaxID=4874 RepID=A0ABN7VEM6_GIGMA|nr:18504_t:CDS:2 [Gigaspora margarita]
MATVIGPKELDAQLILNIYSKCLETFEFPEGEFNKLLARQKEKGWKKTCIENSRKDEKVPSSNVSNSPESVKETICKIASNLEIMVKKSNLLAELLARMKREDIVGIHLNASGNLVVEYSGTSYVVTDNNLTNNQKKIKEFLQQCFSKKSK